VTDFYKSETYLIVKKMKATGNQAGIVQLWKNMVEHWALQSSGPDAEIVRSWLPLWQVREMYCAAELAPIFPALALALGVSRTLGRLSSPKGANRLQNELKFAGLPWRAIGDKIYFAVERVHNWRDAPTNEWEKALFND
jgi:hypothetical protein